MARQRHSPASRDGGAARLIRWPLLLLAGIGGGLLLGEFAAGGRTAAYSSDAGSFSRLSANPDAMVADGIATEGDGAAPCFDCPHGQGIGIPVRRSRDDRMDAEFRELGAVDIGPPAPADPDDGYRYGGRFPDPEPGEWDGMPDDRESVSTATGDAPLPSDAISPSPPPEF